MNQISLKEFVSRFGQTGAATRLGVTQGAVRKALLVEREIYVMENDDGTYAASEVKPFPSIEPSTKKAVNQE